VAIAPAVSAAVLLTIPPGFHTATHGVDLIVKLLLKTMVGWINSHPDAALSRFMTRQRGPRTDVARMSRVQRLAGALVFLASGGVFLGLWLLIAYLTFGLGVFSPDNALVQALIFGLALLAGGGFVGGLYLLMRVLI
jgi:hypothetical protein